MEVRDKVWVFSSRAPGVHSRNAYTGLDLKLIPIKGMSGEVADIAVTVSHIYILQFHILHSIRIGKEDTVKKHELQINIYRGLIASGASIFILGELTLNFSTKSKLTKKTSLSLRGLTLVCKTSFKSILFLIVNPQDKTEASRILTYSTENDQVLPIFLKYRLRNIGPSCAFVNENSLFVFGGKHEQGFSTREFYKIDLENCDLIYLPDLVRRSLFPTATVHFDGRRVAALDSTGSMHVYNFNCNRWKMVSEKYWDRRKNVLWAWKNLQLQAGSSKLYRLPLTLVRKIMIEFM